MRIPRLNSAHLITPQSTLSAIISSCGGPAYVTLLLTQVLAFRVGNRSGQSDFPTRSRPRFPVSDRVRTLRSILIAGSDRVRSELFKSSVGIVLNLKLIRNLSVT